MSINILIPNREKIERVLKITPPSFQGYKKDKLYYLISKVYASGYTEDGVPLCAAQLQNLIGKYYKCYLVYLMENKLIRPSSGYVVGDHCRKYELLIIGKAEWYTITDFTFKKKLKAHKTEVNEGEKYSYLKKWMDGLEIDRYAKDWVHQDLYFKAFYRSSRDERKDFLMQYRNNDIILEYFKSGRRPFLVDNTGHRLHTILSRCNKNLRQFITYEGERLVGIDLKNCQPYLIICLLKKEFWQKKGDPNINYAMFLHGLTFSPTMLEFIMLLLSSGTQYQSEFKRYSHLAGTGNLYEYFEDKLNFSHRILATESVRDEIKVRMMMCFYSSNKTSSRGMKTAFRKEFPVIYSLIKKLKDEEHNTLAILLQRIESYLILDVVCSRIAAENPLVPIFTIHDSLVTTGGNEEYVRNVMAREIQKIIGIEPNLAIENWNESIAWEKHEEASKYFLAVK